MVRTPRKKSLTAAAATALHERMLKKRLYVVFSEPTDKGGDRRRAFPRHIAYQLELERKGILFAAGPFVDEKGKPQGAGMIVIRARTLAEARRIAEADPFHRLGYRRFRIQGWQVNEGGFSLNVRFSDQGFALE